jgi:hypothetical protein
MRLNRDREVVPEPIGPRRVRTVGPALERWQIRPIDQVSGSLG